MKRQFIQLKDSPTCKKGAIFEEKCEGGNQDFELISNHEKFPDGGGVYSPRVAMLKQPEWYQEIFQIPVPKRYVLKVKKYVKSLK